MTIKPGTLVYAKESGRYDIRSGLNEYYGGLHCGQSFEVFDAYFQYTEEPYLSSHILSAS